MLEALLCTGRVHIQLITYRYLPATLQYDAGLIAVRVSIYNSTFRNGVWLAVNLQLNRPERRVVGCQAAINPAHYLSPL